MHLNHELRRSLWRLLRRLARRLRRRLSSSRLLRRMTGSWRSRLVRRTAGQARRHRAAWNADERTMRRVAEVQRGGLSSEQSDARYASGQHPGGIHQRSTAPPPADADSSQHQRPEHEEPQDRVERVRGRERRMPSTRRG
jgi:hypothetical protein